MARISFLVCAGSGHSCSNHVRSWPLRTESHCYELLVESNYLSDMRRMHSPMHRPVLCRWQSHHAPSTAWGQSDEQLRVLLTRPGVSAPQSTAVDRMVRDEEGWVRGHAHGGVRE